MDNLKVKGNGNNSSKKSKNASADISETTPISSTVTASSNTNTSIGSWKTFSTVIYKDYNSTPSTKIYAFDIDDTIITPKSGKKFSDNKNDWKINYPTIKEILKKAVDDGYKIVFISNQGGISKGKVNANDWKAKIDNVQAALDIPLQVFASTESDYYRKPSIGMWRLMADSHNGGKKIEKATYIGDAAGRPKTDSKPKDFSDSDYKFALNNKIDFVLPEVFFKVGTAQKIPKITFNPNDYRNNTNLLKEGSVDKLTSSTKEMVIFCGSAGSGKSTLYHNYFKPKGYGHVNQDTLKTEQKCVKVAEEFLASGQSCVIDNTNPDKAKRSVFIKAAQKNGAQVRCVFFDYPKDLVFHLNNLRDINIFRNHYTKSIADVVIHTWYKKLEKPTDKEGFKEVLTVNFIPGPFENDNDETLFYCYS